VINNGIKEYQTVEMDLTYQGYEPNVLFVKKNIPVHWVINVKQMTGCTDAILMPDYRVDKLLELGENIIEFTPTKIGEIKFSCGMRMVWGKFIVTENEVSQSQKEFYIDNTASSGTASGSCQMAGGSCGCGSIKKR
jgi:plastocyanin domain-containing protein